MVLRQDQQQVLSQRIDPKLIMANAILQQSSLELVQQIEAELLDNPALDIIERDPVCTGNCINPALCPICSSRLARPQTDYTPLEAIHSEVEFHHSSLFDADDEYDPVGNMPAEMTLQDHLRAQLRSAVPEEDYPIGEYLINSLDDNGWLDGTVEEIACDLGEDPETVLRVLRVIQTFDPPGIGARNLQECMLIQLQFLQEEGKGNPLAESMVRDHFADVVSRRYSRLARIFHISLDCAKKTVEFMKDQLNPYPANQFRPPWAYKPNNHKSCIRPDVILRRTEVGYEVEIVGTEPFVLGVSPSYRELYDHIKNGTANLQPEEIKHTIEYVERAELFIKNINQRRRTLRMITQCIIDCQQGFVETGSRAYLRPLTRTRVAEILGMHESTVSRATARKYVQLPNQEVVPFDIFFDQSQAIKTAIEEIISSEDPSNPLSDQQIVELLRERGYEVARRTVVKYRDAQKILSSNRRRR
jgi:RNA polymerase sigma-54 factor